MVRTRQAMAALWAGLALALPAPDAQAGGFALREQSAAGQGQDFAGAAAGSAGLGSLYWNPATLTDVPGVAVQVNGAVLFPFAAVRPDAGTSPLLAALGGTGGTGDVMPNAVLPSGYAAYGVTDRLWLGVAVNSPYGLTTKTPTNYAGQIYARTSQVRSYAFNPDIAFKVTDWLSVGAGIDVLYFKTRLSEALSPLPDAPSGTLTGGAWGVGVTAGVTLKPRAGTEIGVGYRSGIREDTGGRLALGLAPAVPAQATLDLPDQVTVGLRQAVTPALSVSAGYEWTRWSRLGTVAVANPVADVTLPFHFSDAASASLGGEYAWNADLLLRAGVGYQWTPVPSAVRDLRLPEPDMVTLSAGAGYRLTEHIAVDIAYTHYFEVGDGAVAIVPGNPHYLAGLPFAGEIRADADVGSVGLTYRW